MNKNKNQKPSKPGLHHKIVLYLYLIFSALALINFALWYIHFFAPQIDLTNTIKLFDFDNEKNVPTLFNVALLLINASILYFIYKFERKIKDPRHSKWLFLSIILVFMATDEFFILHENLIDPVKNLLNTSGALYFAWVIPMSFVVVAVVLYFFKFFLSLPKDIKTGITIAVGLYLLGALGCEMFGGWWLTQYGDGFCYKMITMVEESLEMISLIYLIKTLFLYEDQDISKEQLLPTK